MELFKNAFKDRSASSKVWGTRAGRKGVTCGMPTVHVRLHKPHVAILRPRASVSFPGGMAHGILSRALRLGVFNWNPDLRASALMRRRGKRLNQLR